MPNKDKNIPKRRFKEFENADAWELRNVREICRISTGKSNTQDREEQGKFPFYVRSPIIEKSTKYLFDEEAVLTVGDGVGTGKVFHYVHGKYDLHQRVYRMFSFTHVNAKYFYYYFSKKFFDRVMAMTAKNSVDSVRLEMISDMEITIPQLEEQEKIVKILSTLDQQITLHQRKLDKLKSVKQAYLSEMFPAEGERVPKRRFPGFTDDWELRKLGELAEIVRGASPRPIQDPKWFDEQSEIGWLRISDVTEQDGRIYHLEQKISKLGQQKTRVLVEPHLLLSIAATVGKPVVNYVKTGVHDGFLIFLEPCFEQEFMFQWLEMFRSYWSKYGQPGSQVNLNSDLVKKQELSIPTLPEQETIGTFFSSLDRHITLHQRKLEKLKNLKKALLNELFV